MNYKEAVTQSRVRKIIGATLSSVALLSTAISILRLLYFGIDERTRIANASFFKHHVYLIYKNTRFLDWLWDNCPTPNLVDLKVIENVYFLLIYYAVFIGLAIYTSGREIRSDLDEVETFNGNHHFSNSNPAETEIDHQVADKPVHIPEVSVMSQFIPLYIFPGIVTLIGGVLFKMLGLI
jgi:hypothetical protein